MTQLRLKFDSGSISGSGLDMVGLFTLHGTINQQGQVAMIKNYIGQHTVDYVGNYDGEGVMHGEWHIGKLRGRWMIRLKSAKSIAAPIEDIAVTE